MLHDISWRIGPGERWLVVGGSGAGKTQLMKVIAGDVWPDAGPSPTRRYRLDGEWLEQPAGVRDEIAWLGPERQDRYERYGWNQPVIDIVGTGLHRTDIPLERLSAAERARCMTLLRRVGIARLAARRFLTLSYGERRLVLLARVLAWRAALLLLDEAATGLDTQYRERLYQLLGARSLRGAGWICSAHRDEDVPPGASHLLWLEAGRVRHAGPLKQSRLREALQASQAEAKGRSVKAKAKKTALRGRGVLAGRSPGARGAKPVVALQNANVWVDGKRLLHGMDWSVQRGESWVVHGANGAGKSTLLRTLWGDHSVASDGHIRRAGIEPGVPLDDFRARTGLIAPHLQTDYPRYHSVLETVVSGLHASIGLNFDITPGERRRALAALASVGMEQFSDRKLGEMSYGQVRRVLFARALVVRPRLLLLDEPFTGLNAPLRRELQAWLESQIAAGTTVVMASHYRGEWPRNASHELMLSKGRIAYAGEIRT